MNLLVILLIIIFSLRQSHQFDLKKCLSKSYICCLKKDGAYSIDNNLDYLKDGGCDLKMIGIHPMYRSNDFFLSQSKMEKTIDIAFDYQSNDVYSMYRNHFNHTYHTNDTVIN